MVVNVSEDVKDKYYGRIKKLNEQKEMFVQFSKRLRENTEKRNKAEKKKRKSKGEFVSGATSKHDIKRLQRILRQKIAEVASEDGDDKFKSLKINDLQRKIESLERILAQMEQLEREAQNEKIKKTGKNKKGHTESVYLSSGDLTVNKSSIPGSSLDVRVSGVPNVSVPSEINLMSEMTADAAVQAFDVNM